MNETEFEIIKDLDGVKIDREFWPTDLCQYLIKTPFEDVSDDFLNHPLIINALNEIPKHKISLGNYVVLFLLINKYIKSGKGLQDIEQALIQILKDEEYTPEAKERGTAHLPFRLANSEFMRKLYATKDEKLIKVFMKFFPKPFDVAQAELGSIKTLKKLLEMDECDRKNIEKTIIKIQRDFRGKKRGKEDVKRLMWNYHISEDEAKEMLHDADKPYVPKCDRELAARILKASEKIQLFNEVIHFTAPKAVTSIINDGLYGRGTMVDFYMPYNPASLFTFDIAQGDLNVVCLGAFSISPSAKQGLELVFDAKQISANNPCVFFKQRDLGYVVWARVRRVKIGNIDISFSHTEPYDKVGSIPEKTHHLLLFNPEQDELRNRQPYAVGTIPNALIISRNPELMQQILTLNFFRYLDSLEFIRDKADHLPGNREIYAELAKMSDEELVHVLQDIGSKMSDTMEFNFYGAYQIDFSALIRITSEKPPFTLELKSFIDDLNAGKIEKFHESKEKLPHLFESYRFMDFLLSTVKNDSVLTELQAQRDLCKVPLHMKPY